MTSRMRRRFCSRLVRASSTAARHRNRYRSRPAARTTHARCGARSSRRTMRPGSRHRDGAGRGGMSWRHSAWTTAGGHVRKRALAAFRAGRLGGHPACAATSSSRGPRVTGVEEFVGDADELVDTRIETHPLRPAEVGKPRLTVLNLAGARPQSCDRDLVRAAFGPSAAVFAVTVAPAGPARVRAACAARAGDPRPDPWQRPR